MDEAFYSLAQARASLGNIGRTKMYQLVDRGDLELVKLDRKSLITGRSLRLFREKLLRQYVGSRSEAAPRQEVEQQGDRPLPMTVTLKRADDVTP